MTSDHRYQTAVHRIESWVYADATARAAATGFVADDVGRLAFQTDAGSYWRLTNHSPAAWQVALPGMAGLCVVYQAGVPVGLYSTLSAALAAITDNAVDKQYHIFVSGFIAETAQITAKSYVHVHGLAGATVTVTLTGAGAAVLYAAVTNSIWRGLRVVRAGAVTVDGVFAGSYTGACDSTVRVEECQFVNQVTVAGGGGDNCWGVSIADSASPTFIGCYVKAADSATYCYGIAITGTSTSKFWDCEFVGGNGGIACYGANIGASAGVTDCRFYNCRAVGGSANATNNFGFYSGGYDISRYYGCTGQGGSGATAVATYGIVGTYYSRAQMYNCVGKGGGGSVNAWGIDATGWSSCLYSHCTFVGGDGGVTAYGGAISNCCSSVFDGCVFQGGIYGIDIPAIYVRDGSGSPMFRNCSTRLASLAGLVNVTVTTTFKLSVTVPTQLLSLNLNVITGGGAGATISIGTTLAGTEILNAVPIESADPQLDTVLGAGALPVLAANGDLYVTIVPGTGVSVDIQWTAAVSFAGCNAVWIESVGEVQFTGCSLVSNCASDAVYIEDKAITANKLRIANCHIEARPNGGAAKKAINAESAYNPAPVYLCTLKGGTTNITAGAGTPNASNIEV